MSTLLPLVYSTSPDHEYEEDAKELYEFDFNNTSNQQSVKQLANDAFLCIRKGNIAPYEREIESSSFWIEGVLQFIVGFLGIVANLTALPILCGPRLRSVFNRLLASLLVLHIMYIILTLLMYIGQSEIESSSSGWFAILFVYVLYPLRPIFLHSTTIITILLSRQRYCAIRHPIEYRNSERTTNPSIPAAKSLLCAILTTAIFLCPRFFETSIEELNVERTNEFNATHFKYVR